MNEQKIVAFLEEKSLFDAELEFEIHILKEQIKDPPCPIDEGVACIEFREKAEFGFETDFDDRSKIEIHLGGISIKVSKKNFEKAYRMYRLRDWTVKQIKKLSESEHGNEELTHSVVHSNVLQEKEPPNTP